MNKVSHVRAYILALVCVVLLAACDLNSGSQPAPAASATPAPITQAQTSSGSSGVALVASPNTLVFSPQQPAQSFFLATTPSGHLQWKVTAKPDWLTLDAQEGEIEENIVEVKATVDSAKSGQGVQSGTIQIISSGGAATIAVRTSSSPGSATGSSVSQPTATISVASAPKLGLSVGNLTFSQAISATTFTISNPGDAPLNFGITSASSVLLFDPASGTVQPGQSIQVRASADLSALPPGSTNSTVTIKTNTPDGGATLPVSMTGEGKANAETSVNRLKFPPGSNSTDFTLKNTGTARLTWTVAPSDAWIQAAPSSGDLAPGASAKIVVTAKASDAPSGYTSGFLNITSNSTGGDIKLPVDLTSADLWVLDHQVIDAEYNQKKDIIVTISADPSQLNIIRPAQKTVQHVSLPAPPNCVSVSPDGLYAAVGHNAHVSYINLSTAKVERTYDVSTDAIDVVLPGNGHVYVFPRTDQWETVRNIDLKTGGETPHEGGPVYAGMLAKLHPSGKYIYGADNGLSPSDRHKFDISSPTGSIVYLGDSRYHGDYQFGGDLWFSEDGSRIFAKSGNVFRASESSSQDMLYAGKLEAVFGLRSAASSTQARKVLVLDGGAYTHPQAPGLRVYDSEFLNFKGTVSLPPFSVPGPNGDTKDAGAEGQYVFINSPAGRVYVLEMADPSSGIDKNWALAGFDLSKLP